MRSFFLIPLTSVILSQPTNVLAQQNSETCQTGSDCCTIPPCKCGTYVNCQNDNCFIATCEICPEGFYCACAAACTRLGGGGFDMMQVCPSGHYCPAYSGSPTACPAGTSLSRTGATKKDECAPCSSFWTDSEEGSASCSLSSNAKIVIGGCAG
eukprot:CAMPEP_0181288968 /NCGR_PEP_ID=MMETSP1101-20121128/631_1 /TAXON_ID=46948 /ORGANISM="Rhodomonas abbreviata, Strain Caron Lab Isolate" /LENGTH=153 /DNA_ID=CAMNT_0023393157 /DNA_START=364 /DNA_END=821 /DNA_ORIENTATION=+